MNYSLIISRPCPVRFDTFKTNLLTIPHTVLGFCSMFLITLLSEAVNDRAIVSMLEDLWALPFLVALYCLPANPNPWIYYVSILPSLRYNDSA